MTKCELLAHYFLVDEPLLAGVPTSVFKRHLGELAKAIQQTVEEYIADEIAGQIEGKRQ